MGKLILIEGTDCCGKSTQFELLIKRLNENKIKISHMKFPRYDTPTGRIVGDCYLGKNGKGFFSEGAINVDPKVAGLYYSADRFYNVNELKQMQKCSNVLLDRYVDSNLAYTGAKIRNKKARYENYNWFDRLEYGFLNLPKPDIRILLYMPLKFANILRSGRNEEKDQHESDDNFRKNVENAYLEVAKMYNYKIINCVKNNQIRSINDINNELYDYILNNLK